MEQPEYRESTCFAFDTYNIIHVDAPQELLDAGIALCDEHNRRLSKTVEGSQVWQANRAQGSPHACGDDLRVIMAAALEANARSNGAFNCAVGPLVELWPFARPDFALPSQQAIDEALARTDCSRISLRDGVLTVPADMRIELGGIAKGYIVDRIAEFYRSNGMTSGFLNFGGNTCSIGPKHDGSPWRFGLQTPFAPYGDYWAIMESVEGSFSTSGTYERGATIDGVRYHHIIDPRTGWPVKSDLLTVTVLAPTAMEADAYSTALFVLGQDEGFELARERGYAALFVHDDGRISFTEGFPIKFVKSPLSGMQK